MRTCDYCDKPHLARGMCGTHYRRWRVAGDPMTVRPPASGPRVEVPTYGSMHDRIRRARGKASEHLCTDCGAPAEHWSYNRSGVAETSGPGGGGRLCVYSTDLTQYDPCCVRCNRHRDQPPRREPHGTHGLENRTRSTR